MAKAEIPFENFIAMAAPQLPPPVMRMGGQMWAGGAAGAWPFPNGRSAFCRYTGAGRAAAQLPACRGDAFRRTCAGWTGGHTGAWEALPNTIKAQRAKAPLGERQAGPERCGPSRPRECGGKKSAPKAMALLEGKPARRVAV